MARQLINTYCIVWKYELIHHHEFKVGIMCRKSDYGSIMYMCVYICLSTVAMVIGIFWNKSTSGLTFVIFQIQIFFFTVMRHKKGSYQMTSFVVPEIKSGDYLPNPSISPTPAFCTHRVSVHLDQSRGRTGPLIEKWPRMMYSLLISIYSAKKENIEGKQSTTKVISFIHPLLVFNGWEKTTKKHYRNKITCGKM